MTESRQQIVVTVAPDGAVLATTRGIKGTGCLDYVALLEDMLDAETTASTFTAEYHEIHDRSHDEVSNDLQQR